jgi:dihydrofolate reductase
VVHPDAEVLGKYDAGAIRELKEEVGDIYVSGSGTLVRAMLADGLVDGLHLCIYPLTLGEGRERLFEADGPSHKMEVELSESYDNGVLYHYLRPET